MWNVGWRRKSIVLLTLFITFFIRSNAQLVFRGKVADAAGKGIKGVAVTLTGEQVKAVSGKEGEFTFSVISAGKYEIRLEHNGYGSFVDSIELEHSDEKLKIFTLFKDRHLEGVIIAGKTVQQQLREEPIKAIVVDAKAFADRPNTLSELMNRSPGVRMRQSGGLGNAVEVSLNGFQGNSVQYFRDGIPLEYLGGAYSINNVPVNLLQRVEVYKGVIPVSLGADALGGAVNLVSRQEYSSYLNASYEMGSFNTHIANISGYHISKNKKVFAGADVFYNYSDNDYRVNVTVTDPVTANPVPANVRLFHNSYQQYFTELQAGIKNTKWADELKFTLACNKTDRASQHPALMTVPYGAVMMHNSAWIGSLRYRKYLLNNKLSVDQFLTYSYINRNRVDTVQGTYDWYGHFTPRSSGVGESPRPSDSDIDFDNFISRTNIRYALQDNHNIELNVVYNYNRRLGSDPYGLRFNGTDVDLLSKPADYAKMVAGLAWESFYSDRKLTNQLLVKHFSFYTKGVNGFLSINSNLDDYSTVRSSHWGIGDAVKYQINSKSFIRASAELTYRLPGQAELFGDNDTRAPNFELKPEKSVNINLGYHYSHSGLNFEISGYYRHTKGMIMLIPIQPPFAQYMNLDSIRGYGLDLDVGYNIGKNVRLSGNLSWQENRMVNISNALYKWMEGTRLRNTPFFFGNLGASGNYTRILVKGDKLKPYIHYNYIREFYLNHIPRDKEPDGFLGIFGTSVVPVTNLIPDQHLISAGFSYAPPEWGLTLGFEVKNILDEKLYDYYKIQRAGRSFHFKINYLLTQKQVRE